MRKYHYNLSFDEDVRSKLKHIAIDKKITLKELLIGSALSLIEEDKNNNDGVDIEDFRKSFIKAIEDSINDKDNKDFDNGFEFGYKHSVINLFNEVVDKFNQ